MGRNNRVWNKAQRIGALPSPDIMRPGDKAMHRQPQFRETSHNVSSDDPCGDQGSRRLIRGLLASALIPAALIVPASAMAQQAVPLPPTRDQIQPVSERDDSRPARLSVEGDIERSSCPLADPAYADIRVPINAVTFNNLKGATPEDMGVVYSKYIGTSQPLSVICDIRDEASTLLRAKGYLAAVQVPTQRIENGEIRFEVLYARLTAVRARGETKGAEKLLEQYLAHLTEGEIFNRNVAERYLLLARDLPGYDVRLTLTPAGTGPGELIGDVTVRRVPYEVDFSVQNLAAPDTGRWGGQVRAVFNGLTGMGDRTSIAYYATPDFQEQHILQLGHEMRVGGEGLTLAGRLTHAWTEPDIGPQPAGVAVKARTLYATLEASYPLVRTEASTLRLTGGLDYVNQRVNFIAPLSRDRLRVAYLRLDAEAIDVRTGAAPGWRLSGSAELRKGFDILDASPGCKGGCPVGITPPSRIDGDPEGALLRLSGEAEVALGDVAAFVLRPRAQYAFDPLFSFEEFSGGNYTVGRGYDPAAIIGDSGIGTQAELRLRRFEPFAKGDLSLQPYLFADAAWVWNRNAAAGSNPDRLISVGGGVRASLANRFRLDVALAIPTEKAGLQAQRGDVRLLVSLTTRLLPWGDR